MTRTTRSLTIATFLAAALGAAALATPAAAGGQVALTFNAQTPQQAQAMKMGLGLYAFANGLKSGGTIIQNGFGNMAGLAQTGAGNFGLVHQEGNGHTGTLTQTGNGNAHGLFQFGENSDGHVTQTGNGQAGATVVLGW
ncbi:curlin [Microbaculum marinisediminis]|uniref:Curlin n=1 Tax=Microbaculum marinisediminis TaxID=2931392 RepID=A0AAW5QUF9_9HYPH|nr:curlin [Microbaculum sp. A6E488]MCT8971681.1 curlin [Microbaculum sp. A6E488]